MQLTVRVGSAQATLLEVVPGRRGEALAVENALRSLDPAVVAVDASLAEAAAGREPWVASAIRGALVAHGERDPASPHAAAASFARARRVELVPLLGASERPGFLVRRRVAKALAALPGGDAASFARRARAVAAAADAGLARMLLAGEEAMAARLRSILVEEQRTRVVALVTLARSERIVGFLLGAPVAEEVARVGHDVRV